MIVYGRLFGSERPRLLQLGDVLAGAARGAAVEGQGAALLRGLRVHLFLLQAGHGRHPTGVLKTCEI